VYLARPPITPKHPDQLDDKPSVKLHRGAGNVTTVMVRDDDQIRRHPVTGKFTSKWQNEQSSQPADEDTKIGKKDDGRGVFPKNEY
jgi:hypothetical protein